jgi:hypothetical protein
MMKESSIETIVSDVNRELLTLKAVRVRLGIDRLHYGLLLLSPCYPDSHQKPTISLCMHAFVANIEQGSVFKKDSLIKWKCRNCGYVYEGSEAPEKFPVWEHAKSYFEVWCENY